MAPPHRLGSAPGGGRGRPPPLHRLEGPCSPRHLAPSRAPREEARRYEWPCPGDLLHMDTSRYARFERPGHRRHRRSLPALARLDEARRPGWATTSPTRSSTTALAPRLVELHPDEKAADRHRLRGTCPGVVLRPQGIEARRLMTDNALRLRHATARCASCSRPAGIKHLTTQPYRPQTNGKVERFHQTMAREWAYGMAYRSHRHRNRALPHWLEHYNETRPHSSLGAGRRSAAFTTSVGRTSS